MKKTILLVAIALASLCIAQDTAGDYPAGVRIIFSDGTAIQLACAQDGSCRVIQKATTSATAVTQINLGFSMKHGYILKVQ